MQQARRSGAAGRAASLTVELRLPGRGAAHISLFPCNNRVGNEHGQISRRSVAGPVSFGRVWPGCDGPPRPAASDRPPYMLCTTMPGGACQCQSRVGQSASKPRGRGGKGAGAGKCARIWAAPSTCGPTGIRATRGCAAIARGRGIVRAVSSGGRGTSALLPNAEPPPPRRLPCRLLPVRPRL